MTALSSTSTMAAFAVASSATASLAAPTVEDRKSEFVATSGGADGASAELLLGTAYVLMWLFAFVMIVRTYQKQAKLGARIAQLETALGRKVDQPLPAPGRAAPESADSDAAAAEDTAAPGSGA